MKKTGKTIMLVDDDPVIQALVSKALTQNGFNVISAVTGKEASEKLTQKNPDMIILDIILPDMDGTDIAGALQEHIETMNIPVVYLTSLADKEQASLSSTHNPDIVFTKPVDLKALIEKIKELDAEIEDNSPEVFQNNAIFQKKEVRKRILVVDDDNEILNLLQTRLSHHGYEVLCSVNGKNALLKARQSLPDLIILDVMLPEIDGTEIARFLKLDESTAHIPVIFVTALKNQLDVSAVDQFEKNVVLSKPFDAKQLIAKIEELI